MSEDEKFQELILSKINEGDIRGALRMLSSKDALADYDEKQPKSFAQRKATPCFSVHVHDSIPDANVKEMVGLRRFQRDLLVAWTSYDHNAFRT